MDNVIALGAEAKIYESNFFGYPVICKQRSQKKYRNSKIDFKLRKERTVQEVRLLQFCHKNKIPVPKVLDVDKGSWTIIMDQLEGKTLKEYIIDNKDIISKFEKIGELLGKLHSFDIIHGDLTTSNILYAKPDQFWLIDFGLGFISTHIEDKAVDILVLKHTLESSHSQIAEDGFNKIKVGYHNYNNDGNRIFKRLNEVESRVRYREHAVV